MREETIILRYEAAKEQYAEAGVDTQEAIKRIDQIPVSMNAWEGDDLLGFEGGKTMAGGVYVTGTCFGRARTAGELRQDLTKALEQIPGSVKVSIHAIHGNKNGRAIDRDSYDVDMFMDWIDWANERDIGLDFNPAFFSHDMMDGDFSLTSNDPGKRRFWINHGKCCRKIANEIGKKTGKTCLNNFGMPDGYKDIPADTVKLRERMIESLDEIFKEEYDAMYTRDAIESRVFGLGAEGYTVASHEFSLLYAATRNVLYTLDAGHFHPTESIAAKLSAVLEYLPEVMLRVSRGVRWPSGHVVIWDDELQHIADEIIRNQYDRKVHVGLDCFDASVNRLFAWVIGARNIRKALLKAALDPIERIRKAESKGDYGMRLALLEETKSMPFAAVWDYYCMVKQVPIGQEWLETLKQYEKKVLLNR